MATSNSSSQQQPTVMFFVLIIFFTIKFPTYLGHFNIPQRALYSFFVWVYRHNLLLVSTCLALARRVCVCVGVFVVLAVGAVCLVGRLALLGERILCGSNRTTVVAVGRHSYCCCRFFSIHTQTHTFNASTKLWIMSSASLAEFIYFIFVPPLAHSFCLWSVPLLVKFYEWLHIIHH